MDIAYYSHGEQRNIILAGKHQECNVDWNADTGLYRLTTNNVESCVAAEWWSLRIGTDDVDHMGTIC